MMILLVLSIAVAKTLFSTGFFREIYPGFEGRIVEEIQLPGVEDIAICRADSFLILSMDDRAARRDGNAHQGGLYKIDLRKPIEPVLISGNFDQTLYPHGISLLKTDSGQYQLLVINHVQGKHTVEKFALFGDSLVHKESISDPALISPNDLVAIDENHFYVTNDHKYRSGMNRFFEDYLGLAISNVVYFDNGGFSEVADGIAYANGINYDVDRNLMFVASPRGFRVKVYSKQSDGNLEFIEDIRTRTGVDNIEFDEDGKLWIGCHPNLMKFARYATGKTPESPSEIITIDYRGEDDYEVKSVFVDDGSIVSASTVAVPFGNLVFIGNVMDESVVVWEKE